MPIAHDPMGEKSVIQPGRKKRSLWQFNKDKISKAIQLYPTVLLYEGKKGI